jgi:hypothetical protein
MGRRLAPGFARTELKGKFSGSLATLQIEKGRKLGPCSPNEYFVEIAAEYFQVLKATQFCRGKVIESLALEVVFWSPR